MCIKDKTKATQNGLPKTKMVLFFFLSDRYKQSFVRFWSNGDLDNLRENLLYISKGQIKISLPYVRCCILSETLLPSVPGNLKSLTQSSFPVNIWSWGLLARWTTKLCPVWLWWRAPLYWLWLCREAIMKTFEMACYLDWMQVFKRVTKSFERAKSVFIQDEGVHVCPRWIDGL